MGEETRQNTCRSPLSSSTSRLQAVPRTIRRVPTRSVPAGSVVYIAHIYRPKGA